MSFSRPVMLCAHGTRSAAGALAIRRLVAGVQAARPDLEIHEAFVDVQHPHVDDVARTLRGRHPVLVPLLLSAGHHVRVDLARAARLGGGDVAPPLGPDPALTRLLAAGLDRQDGDPRVEGPVVLAAAGSSDPRAHAHLEATAADLGACLGRPVHVAHASGGHPRLSDLLPRLAADGPPRVVSYLLAPGHFSRVVSRAAAEQGGRHTPPLLSPDSPAPAALVDLVLDRIDATVAARAA